MPKHIRLLAACLLLAALPAAADVRVVTDGDPNGADDLAFILPLSAQERLADLSLIEDGRTTSLLANFQQERLADGQLRLRLQPAIDFDRFTDVKAELRASIAAADGSTRTWRQAIAIVPASAFTTPVQVRQAVAADAAQIVPVLPLAPAGNAQLTGIDGGPAQAALPYQLATGPDGGAVAVVQTPLPYRLGEPLAFDLGWQLSPGGKVLKQPVSLVPTALADLNRDLDVAAVPLAFEAGAASNLAIEDLQSVGPQASSVLNQFDTAATPSGNVRFQLRAGQELGATQTLVVQKRLNGKTTVSQLVRVAASQNANGQAAAGGNKANTPTQSAATSTVNASALAAVPPAAAIAPAPAAAVETPPPPANPPAESPPQRRAAKRSGNSFAATGPSTQFEYDANGNRTRMTDPLGRTTSYAYDSLNRLVSSTDPAGGVTALGYDPLNRLTSVTDPRGLVTSAGYDGLGRPVSQSSPDAGNSSNAYDAAGNLLSHTDAKGQTTSYSYDALNRLTQASYADGSRTSYLYDQGAGGIGRLTRIEEHAPDGSLARAIQYAYDALGRVVSDTRTVAGHDYVTRYRYDQGRLAGIVYPSGRIIDYGFDAAGRVNEVRLTDNGQTKVLANAIRYYPFGGVTAYTNGAGANLTRSFDDQGRIQAVTLGTDTWQLTIDAASRITAQTDTANPAASASYGYDALDRLTSAALPGTTLGYAYDANGNRTQETRGTETNSYVIDPASNRVLSATGTTTKTYSYDANGSLTGDGQRQFGYDGRGRLTRAILAASMTYEINALGQRVRKQGGDTDVVFNYDLQGRLISESAADGSRFHDYVWLGDLPLAVIQ